MVDPPSSPPSLRARAEAALARGDVGGGLDFLLAAIRGGETDPALWARFASVVTVAGDLESMTFEALDAMLALCLAQKAVSPRLLGPTLAVHLRRHPILGPLIADAADHGGPPGPSAGDRGSPLSISGGDLSDPTIYTALAAPTPRQTLELCVIADLGFERLVAGVRRSMVLAAAADHWDHPGLDDLGLICAVARQCFFTGYVHAVGDAEVAAVEALVGAMAGRPLGEDPHDPIRIGLLSAYVPLLEWERVGEVVRLVTRARTEKHPPRRSPEALRPLLKEQVADPVEEAELRESLPTLAPIADTTSRRVQDMYEAHPYPRWHRPVYHEARTLPALLDELFPESSGPLDGLPAGPLRILVAGCGTGSHPLATKMLLPESTVVGVDLSAASLAFAMRKTLEIGTDGVGFVQADILDLAEWDATFDLIESIGVLHHMADPVQGWQALLRRLRPGGLMRIGLYSERARTLLGELRAFLEGEPIGDSDNDLRAARHRAIDFLTDHPRGATVLRWRDFYSLHEFRDLVLHPQEHQFTPQGLARIIADLELEFLGFAPLPRDARAAFTKRYPDPASLCDLRAWEEFEQDYPDTFQGMYQFWVRKPA